MQNYFELFQLPQQFALESAKLDAAYHEVQGRVHPDRFVQASDAERRVAMQWATHANEAYQVLKKPLRRARYLCELNGISLQTESNTSMPAAFLMQQMEWREALDDARAARNLEALHELEAELKLALNSELQHVAHALDTSAYDEAASGIRRAMFLEKFMTDIAALEEYFE